MYIQPTTNIKVYNNVPVDNKYRNTLYFNNIQEQNNYFQTRVAYDFSKYSYQRVNDGVLRVGVPTDGLYACNYMSFNNINFGNKQFYAFITAVEYVNNECSNIYFEIDVLQTWFFNYTLLESFVEREHSSSDKFGEHLEPEPVDIGEYVYSDYKSIMGNDQVVIIAIVDLSTAGGSSGNRYDGIYGGAQLFAYDCNTSSDMVAINTKINEYVQKPDAIINMYMCPKYIVPTIPDSHLIPFGGSGVHKYQSFAKPKKTTKIGSYTPKNNKLHTFPYYFIHLDNSSGQELNLRYEYFSGDPLISYVGNLSSPVSIIARPCNYKGTKNDEPLCSETLQLNGYPLCSWNVDTYKAWLAQNSVPIAISAIKPVALGVNPISWNNGEGLKNILGQVADISISGYKASIQADTCKGNFNNGNANYAGRTQKIYAAIAHVTPQYAKMIDDFFTMFGYTCRMVKVPNRAVRPKWCYTKTVGCNLNGNLPADDQRKIAEIYDNGVTFWKDATEVGNYSLDNSV